jgi:copper oxidase (laccase) domain-containing protein
MYFADCLPIFIEGKNGHAVLHAGWAGLKSKICLQKEIFEIKPTHVFIGPHISSSNYEVQKPFKENFLGSKNFTEQNGKLYFDILNEVKEQLLGNFPDLIINDLNICTFEDKNLNSYRRNKTANRNYNLYLPFGDICEN